jgi:REP element-mobilizing transposase RayT
MGLDSPDHTKSSPSGSGFFSRRHSQSRWKAKFDTSGKSPARAHATDVEIIQHFRRVGKAALRGVPTIFAQDMLMPRYVRAKLKGSVFFITVVLADRSSRLLVDEIDRLRIVYRTVQQRRPFETIAICVLRNHIHAVGALPEQDSDFSSRWSLIKSGFSHGLAPLPRSASKVRKRGEGHLATSLLGARHSR